PQVRDRDRDAVVVGERAEESAAPRVVGIDAAIAVVAYEQSAAEPTEIRRRQGEPPRRIERALGSETLQQVAARVENIDETVALASDVILVGLVLLGIGDEEQIVDVLDVERGKPFREFR